MSVAAPEHEAPLLVVADRIHTLTPGGIVRALLARTGRVVAVGRPEELLAVAPHARVLDLTGATVTPGLTDAHVHLTEWAITRRDVQLGTAASPHEAARMVADHPRDGSIGWIRGAGWNPHLWHGAQPHRALLDEFLPDTPVALQSHDMHALWVNGSALRAAGIDAATADPPGGRIARDEKGRPTGLLLEWAAELVTRVMPAPDETAAVHAVRDAQHELHSLGITGVHSFPGIHLPRPDPLTVLQQLSEAGQLQLRVLQHVSADRLDAMMALGLRSGFGSDWLRIGAVKLFIDGALGSRTAWMRAPYEDGSGCGMQTMDAATLRQTVRRAAAAGIASAVHAIGDAAVSLALDVLSDPDIRVSALPHRIEHMQCVPPERLADAAAAGIVCSMQPSHLMTDWSAADRYWGHTRSRGAFAHASLLTHGTVLAFGSDAPVEPIDPRRGLHAAVARQDAAGLPEHGWFPAERITPAAALTGYTVGTARAAGRVDGAGTLVPGAPADLVAWDHDPLAEPEAVMRMQCVATVVGGEVVYAR